MDAHAKDIETCVQQGFFSLSQQGMQHLPASIKITFRQVALGMECWRKTRGEGESQQI